MSEIIKPKNDLTTPKIKIGSASPLQQRVAQAASVKAERQTIEAASVATMPNRIGMMLDVSGSMAGDKIDQLRIAACAFLDSCDASNTAVAVNTFEALIRINLSNSFQYHKQQIKTLSSTGSTPMGLAMSDMLSNESLTRAVIVSDGEPDDSGSVIEWAENFREASVPIDTVHIGDSESGESILRQVAEITGGLYMKFKNVQQFGQAFKYLTPKYRALLADPEVRAKLGAS